MIEFAQAVICFAEKFVPVIEKVFPFLEKFFPNIGKVNLKISNVEMNLDIPRESDGEGGFIHGSRGSFSVEIINKKGITVLRIVVIASFKMIFIVRTRQPIVRLQ